MEPVSFFPVVVEAGSRPFKGVQKNEILLGSMNERIYTQIASMKHFTALYIAPVNMLDEWMKTPEAERKEAEGKMQQEWGMWMSEHKDAVLNTISLGVTKRVSQNGIEDAKNGMMLSSYVAAESLEAAAELFKGHPHLGIPGATIEIMEARPMGER